MRDTVGARWTFETDRYIAWPAQSAGYKIGMVKILELRQKAMDELGDQFDIKEFHRVVLGNGSVPLDILERVVQDYIDTKLGKTSTQTGYVPAFEPDICHFFPPYGYEVECGYLIVPENRSKVGTRFLRTGITSCIINVGLTSTSHGSALYELLFVEQHPQNPGMDPGGRPGTLYWSEEHVREPTGRFWNVYGDGLRVVDAVP
jgi:hypothetical protein